MTTVRSEDHARIARDFLEARARGDYDVAVALLTRDAVWHSPVEGPRRGRAMIREMLAAAERDTESFSSRLEGVEARGKRAVATIVNHGERKGEQLDSRQGEEQQDAEHAPRGSGLRFAVGELLSCTRCSVGFARLERPARRVATRRADRHARPRGRRRE